MRTRSRHNSIFAIVFEQPGVSPLCRRGVDSSRGRRRREEEEEEDVPTGVLAMASDSPWRSQGANIVAKSKTTLLPP